MRVVATLAAASCDPGVASVEPTTESLHEHVFRPHCALPECHSIPEPKQGLDFGTPESTLATTVGVPPKVGSAAQFFPAIIVPGDPEAGFLIHKVTNPGLDRGLPMPPTDVQLTAETVDVMREWIARMEP